MSAGLVGEALLESVARITSSLGEQSFAISGDAARCLWMLDSLTTKYDAALWKKICHPWPAEVTVVTATDLALPDGSLRDQSPIAIEFGTSMIRDRQFIAIPGSSVRTPLVQPAFVLAEILLENDPLRVTRIADLLRCLEAGDRALDIEEVRVLLKAVKAGEHFGLLAEVAAIL